MSSKTQTIQDRQRQPHTVKLDGYVEHISLHKFVLDQARALYEQKNKTIDQIARIEISQRTPHVLDCVRDVARMKQGFDLSDPQKHSFLRDRLGASYSSEKYTAAILEALKSASPHFAIDQSGIEIAPKDLGKVLVKPKKVEAVPANKPAASESVAKPEPEKKEQKLPLAAPKPLPVSKSRSTFPKKKEEPPKMSNLQKDWMLAAKEQYKEKYGAIDFVDEPVLKKRIESVCVSLQSLAINGKKRLNLSTSPTAFTRMREVAGHDQFGLSIQNSYEEIKQKYYISAKGVDCMRFVPV